MSGACQISVKRPTAAAKYRPEGEKTKVETGSRKVKWYRVSRRGRLVNIALPSSSTERSRLPRGSKAAQEILRRWAKGSVKDSLLLVLANNSVKCDLKYWMRSKTVMRLPTGESKEVPSGVKVRLPLP